MEERCETRSYEKTTLIESAHDPTPGASRRRYACVRENQSTRNTPTAQPGERCGVPWHHLESTLVQTYRAICIPL